MQLQDTKLRRVASASDLERCSCDVGGEWRTSCCRRQSTRDCNRLVERKQQQRMVRKEGEQCATKLLSHFLWERVELRRRDSLLASVCHREPSIRLEARACSCVHGGAFCEECAGLRCSRSAKERCSLHRHYSPVVRPLVYGEPRPTAKTNLPFSKSISCLAF